MAGAALLAATAVVLVVCSSASASGNGSETRRRRAALPAVYVFGDSLVDVGNNEFLPPPAPKAGSPCGVDLPRGTPGRRTGRFTNGYNLADFVGESPHLLQISLPNLFKLVIGFLCLDIMFSLEL